MACWSLGNVFLPSNPTFQQLDWKLCSVSHQSAARALATSLSHSSAGRNSDVLVVFQERTVPQLLHSTERPADTLEGELDGKGHIDDDLLVYRLFLPLDDVQVLSAN